MALDLTYAGLVASIMDFTNRSDLASVIPDFIVAAESEMNRLIRCADMITSSTLAISTATTALPSTFNGMISFELPAGTGAPMRYIPPEGLRALRQSAYSATGTPFAWSIVGTNIETVPAPSGSLTCTIIYYGRLSPIGPSTSTNWLLTKHPDAYLYGALVQSAPYLKNDERLATWGQLFLKAINDINGSDGRVAMGHGLGVPFRGAAMPDGTDPRPIAPMAPGG